MNETIININTITYISLGSYCDNQDGPFAYYPDIQNKQNWKLAISQYSLTEKLFIISNAFYIISDSGYTDDYLGGIIKENFIFFKKFINKYFEDYGSILKSIFIDSIWGDLPSNTFIISKNIKIDDLDSQIFIEKKYYNEFLLDLDDAYNLIIK